MKTGCNRWENDLWNEQRREKNLKDDEGKIHMISTWVCEDRISIAQEKTDKKSNEITKIPEMLSALDVYGSVVT